MKVLHVCSEFFPLMKTGGLADVLGALPVAEKTTHVETRVLLPAFPDVLHGIGDTRCIAHRDTFAGPMRLLHGHFKEEDLYLIEAPHLYDRPGSPYHDSHLHEYTDNVLRFALLGWVGCELACGLDPTWSPDIIHAHDWHAGLTPAYLAARGHPAKSVFTVHNLAYQGLFSAHHMHDIQLPWSFYNVQGLEFHGQISYLKAGLYYADHITTVSPTYAKEITAPEFAYGLEGLLQQRQREGKLSGILNGVDEDVWDPATDLLLSVPYNGDTLEAKAENKRQLQMTMKLQTNDDMPLFAVVSRLDSQKGLDLVLEVLPALMEQGGQLALLGTGDPVLQAAFLAAAVAYPGQVGVEIDYDEEFSHRMIAGADVILVPSRFEPCGLTQLYGLKYGTLPLVRRTGGLADTVTDSSPENIEKGIASGFVFEHSEASSLLRAIQRAFSLWSSPSVWRDIQRHAMTMHFGWQVAARSYCNLYSRLTYRQRA